MLPARANGETFVSATMCPQQCVLVCQGFYLLMIASTWTNKVNKLSLDLVITTPLKCWMRLSSRMNHIFDHMRFLSSVRIQFKINYLVCSSLFHEYIVAVQN